MILNGTNKSNKVSYVPVLCRSIHLWGRQPDGTSDGLGLGSVEGEGEGGAARDGGGGNETPSD